MIKFERYVIFFLNTECESDEDDCDKMNEGGGKNQFTEIICLSKRGLHLGL